MTTLQKSNPCRKSARNVKPAGVINHEKSHSELTLVRGANHDDVESDALTNHNALLMRGETFFVGKCYDIGCDSTQRFSTILNHAAGP